MKNSKIFETLSIGKFYLKNRIAMAPMTRGRAGIDRVPDDLMAEYYFQRAGAGLLITEATVVSEQGIGWIDTPGIYTDAMVEGWQKVTKKVKPTGTPIFLQLWHCGRASHSDFHDGSLPVSASAVKLNGDSIPTPLGSKPYETPRIIVMINMVAALKTDFVFLEKCWKRSLRCGRQIRLELVSHQTVFIMMWAVMTIGNYFFMSQKR